MDDGVPAAACGPPTDRARGRVGVGVHAYRRLFPARRAAAWDVALLWLDMYTRAAGGRQGRTGKFKGPVRNNGLGPSGLVQDREYQTIAVGKRDVLCESTNVRSHTCD